MTANDHDRASSRALRAVASVLLALLGVCVLLVVSQRYPGALGHRGVLESLIAVATLGAIATIVLNRRRNTPLAVGALVFSVVLLLTCYLFFIK